MFERLENIVNSVRSLFGTASENEAYQPSRRGFLKLGAYSLPLIAAAACDCGGDSGSSGGSGGNGTPKDTIPPATIGDLTAQASTQYGERVILEFQQPGDDGYGGKPQGISIRVSDSPISTETDWDNAYVVDVLNGVDIRNGGSNRTLEYDLSQIQELVNNGLTSGDLYFSVRAFDEENIADLSNSPTAYIPSKAEFYVDKWLPMDDSVYLTYDESVAMIQGEAGVNPSYAADLAAEMIQCDPPYPRDEGGLTQDLLDITDGDPLNDELHSGFDPFYLDDDAIGTPKVRLYFAPDGNSVNDFDNLPDQAMINLHNIIKDFLIPYVEAHPEDYGGTVGGSPDPDHNPNWV